MSNLVNEILGNKDSAVCYRKIGDMQKNYTLACGFLRKNQQDYKKTLMLDYYGGLFLFSGEGVYHDEVNTIEFEAGDFIQRLPYQSHSTTISKNCDWLEFFICIDTSSYKNLVNMGLMSNSPVLKGNLPAEIIEMFPLFYLKLVEATESELIDLFFEACNMLCKITAHMKQEDSSKEIIAKSLEFINNHNGKISGKDLSKMISVPYETFRKKFQKTMGISLSKYIVLCRISKIKEALLNSDLSLSEIAYDFGYSDYFSFSKQFKQYNFMSPFEYRKKYKLT